MIDKLKSAARFAWDVLAPRFLTEDVAMRRIGPGSDWDNFEIVCAMRDVEFWERFDDPLPASHYSRDPLDTMIVFV